MNKTCRVDEYRTECCDWYSLLHVYTDDILKALSILLYLLPGPRSKVNPEKFITFSQVSKWLCIIMYVIFSCHESYALFNFCTNTYRVALTLQQLLKEAVMEHRTF